MALLVGKSSNSTISSNQGNNRYGKEHSQNTLPDLFSHQIIWFVLGVSLHNSETSGNHALENLETGA